MKQMHDDSTKETAFQQILDGSPMFGAVEPGPFLEAKIMRRLDAEMQAATSISTGTWRLRLAGLALLFAINAVSFAFLTRPRTTAAQAPASLTETYWAYEQDITR